MKDGILGWRLTSFISFIHWFFVFFGPSAPTAPAFCDLPSNKHQASLSSPSAYLFLWHLTDAWYHNRLPNPSGSHSHSACVVCVFLCKHPQTCMLPQLCMSAKCVWPRTFHSHIWGFIFWLRLYAETEMYWSSLIGSFGLVWLRIICPGQ